MKFFGSVFIAYFLMVTPASAKLFGLASIEKANVAVGLNIDAEYVAANLTIQNDDRDPIKRLQLLKKAKEALEDKVRNLNYASIALLPVTLDVDRHYKVIPIDKTVLNYRLLISLSEYENDFYEATTSIRNIVDSLPKIEDTKYSLSDATLAIENPEQYRNKILDLVVQDLQNIKQKFGKKLELKLSGLNNAVNISRLENIKVFLFINYQMELIAK